MLFCPFFFFLLLFLFYFYSHSSYSHTFYISKTRLPCPLWHPSSLLCDLILGHCCAVAHTHPRDFQGHSGHPYFGPPPLFAPIFFFFFRRFLLSSSLHLPPIVRCVDATATKVSDGATGLLSFPIFFASIIPLDCCFVLDSPYILSRGYQSCKASNLL